MIAFAESSGNGWAVADAICGDDWFQSEPILARMVAKRSTITCHEPLESPIGTPSPKSQVNGTAWRLNRCLGHSATGSQGQSELARSASLPTLSARQLATAAWKVASPFLRFAIS